MKVISVSNARKLLEITDAAWRLITDEEFLQIIEIYYQAANRAEKEVDGQ